MRNQRRLRAKLQGVESALERLKSEHDKGQIEHAAYLKLTVEYESPKAELEQALAEALDDAPSADEISPGVAEPVRRRMPTSAWFAVGLVCLVAALAFAAASGWLPGASPSLGDTKTRSSDGMVMVYAPGGTFFMGSNDGGHDEQPVHSVTLDSFWIDRTEVSNVQYKQCVDASKCQAPTMCDWGEPTYRDASKTNHPVVCVDWYGAKAYCEWAGGRLPTEAEWEYAARGPEGNVYPWGNDEPDCDKANYWGRDDGCVGATSAVGSYPAGDSWCGALDMVGNVWKWVDDWYNGYPDTSYQSDRFGTQYKVLRGGSWDDDPACVRAVFRNSSKPDYRSNDVGFRCVVEPGW